MTGICSEHDKCIESISTDISQIKTALLGDMENEGWLSRIRDLEKKMSVIIKTAVTGLSLIGVQLVAFIYSVMTHKIYINW